MSERKRVRFGKFSIGIPGTKTQRTVLGGVLSAGGFLGFLPILGFWMLPLGLIVLSVDHHPVRRFRRRAEVWWGRRQKPKSTEPPAR
jgi:purine-cytosine permease-like protein